MDDNRRKMMYLMDNNLRARRSPMNDNQWKIEDRLKDNMAELRVSVDRIVARIDGIRERMDGMAERLDGVVERMGSMTTRMNGMQVRMDGMKVRMDSIARPQDSILNQPGQKFSTVGRA